MTKQILWDFDGTLAERPFMWSNAFLGAINKFQCNLNLTLNDIRPHLQSGFPWHTSEDSWETQVNPVLWWKRMKNHFNQVFLSLGCDPNNISPMLEHVHSEAISPDFYKVYDDVEETLKKLSDLGWKHSILSNHMPELPQIVDAIGLSPYFEKIFTSALIGYSKPHPKIFQAAIEKLDPKAIWMIGDNYDADIVGAESIGINAILVRKSHSEAKYVSQDLPGTLKWLATS